MKRHPAWRLGNRWPHRLAVRLGLVHSPSGELAGWCVRCHRQVSR